jgi:lambda family phage portal protein|tara:strand:- start:2284 stop:3765 length:1482 start_codon:yes stop_codon:yes gene_type:complete
MNFIQRIKKASKFVFQYGSGGSGYAAAIDTRYRGRRGYSEVRSEEKELDINDRGKIVSTLLDFRRNNSIVKSICRLRETDVVGNGIIPKPATGDEMLDERLWELWEDFSQKPEVSHTMNMRDVQQQLAAMPLIFGDGGLLKTRTGKLQIIEGDLIGTEQDQNPFKVQENPYDENARNIIDGIEVSKVGRPMYYYIGERDADGGLSNIRKIPARDFLFHKKFIRPTQVRGIPELATVVNDLQDIDEYDSIEMISAKVSASLSAIVKRQGSLDFELNATANGDNQAKQLQSFEPGQFHYLEPDEDVSVISSGGRPNVDAIEYLLYRLRKIGSTIGMPVEFLLMTIGKTSFSASQGMILLYQQTVENEQRLLIPLLTDIYRWKVANWIKDPTLDLIIPDGAKPFKVGWQPPSFRWVNRAAQVKADTAYLQMGAISLDDVTSTFGYDAATVLEKKAQNIRTAMRLADEYGLKDWRELLNPLTTYGNVNLLDLMEAEN